MNSYEIAYASAAELTAAYAAGSLDPVEVVTSQLARIAALNPRLNAYIHVFDIQARAEAEASSARWRAGVPLGPLDGVPVAVKDLADVAGWPTGCGSKAVDAAPAQTSATIVTRLRAAGAILLGKTQMVEFACGGWGTNAVLGTPWNPWDGETHRAPGGSSSGSGVAVAAGLATVAIGSDTGGSVRIPSAFCGLTGLKTCVGRISVAGTGPLAKTFDSLGPMARNVRDAALIFDAVMGPDPRDRVSLPLEPTPTAGELARGIAGLRVGTMPDAERDGVAPGVLEAYDAAADLLRSLGAEVRPVALPEMFDDARPRCGGMIMAEGYAATRQWIERDDVPLDPHVRQRLLSGRETSLADYLALKDDCERTRAVWARAMEGVDALITPTVALPAPPVAQVDETSFLAARFTRAGNYLDWSAVATPMGLSEGLPVSLQIYTGQYREGLALRFASAFQQASEHHQSRALAD